MNILIAPNSFKEVADSDKVAALIRSYLQNDSTHSIETLPISDGGDGFLNVCKSIFNLGSLNYDITTPFDDTKFNCEVGYDSKEKKIYIESARVLGLRVIPKKERKLLKLSSKGIGDLFISIIEDIKNQKIDVKEVIIGIGGTGTNDLGLGVCSRFGLELYDIYGKKDTIIPEYYYRIKDFNWKRPEFPFNIKVIQDVDNPLLGAKGAARTFSPQKGADKGEVEVLELGFHKIINLLKKKQLDRSFDKLSGAGGGLAAGFDIFFGASSISAGEFIRKELQLDSRLERADIVITGEGSFDNQSLNGKGAGIVVKRATDFGKKVILCCGKVENGVRSSLADNVEIIEINSFFESSAEAINSFEKGIEYTCNKINSLL
jgi:glycerate 2-kinase